MKNSNQFFAFLLALFMAVGSTGSIKGQVVVGQVFDRENNLPLVGATISAAEAGYQAVSDEKGQFKINFPAPGSYAVRISYVGYETMLDTVKTGNSKPQIFYLAKGVSALGEVVITCTKSSIKNFHAPGFVSTISFREALERMARTTPELLMVVPGVWIQKTNHGGGSPGIRGLQGNQVLLMLDGIRLNNSTKRYGPNQDFNTIDVFSVASIEVLRGAGSVLYGSDAIGGTINVLTMSPRFSSQGWRWGGAAIGRYLSGGMEKTVRTTLHLSGENMTFLGGLSYRDFGDLIAGGSLGKEAPSSYKEMAGDFKGLIKIGSQGMLTIAYNGVTQTEVGRYDQVAQRGYSLYQFNPQNRQFGYAKYQQASTNKWFNQTTVVASIQQSLEGRQSMKNGSIVMREETDKVTTLGLLAEFHSAPVKELLGVTGVEYYSDVIRSSAQDKDMETRQITPKRGLYPDGARAANMAVFSNHTLTLNRLQIGLGARFNVVNIAIEDQAFGNTKISPSAFVWSSTVRYALHQYHALFFNAFTGFRSPNINDMSTFGRFDSGIEVPSYNLLPEKSFTMEMGYKWLAEWIEGNVVVYNMQLSNLITRVPTMYNGSTTYQGDAVYSKENTAKANVQGVETGVKINLTSQLCLAGNVTYTYGQDITNKEPMRRIPPLNGRAAVSWRHQKGFFAQAEYLFAGTQKRLSNGDVADHRIQDDGTPGWSLINVQAGYEWKWLKLNAGFQNLTNEAYRIHGSGVDGVGRSAWLSAAVSF